MWFNSHSEAHFVPRRSVDRAFRSRDELPPELASLRAFPIIGRVHSFARSASIVIPTFREVANLETLIHRIMAAVRPTGWEVEIVIVDDNSADGTEELIDRLRDRYPVRILVRRGERGLASAVLTGFQHARFAHFVVLDADLQHPPEHIPEVLQRLEVPGCEFVLGTRYGPEGAIVVSWPWMRRLASRLATLAAWPLVGVSDPMSGFFGLPRSTFERAERLDPVGYKIALELMVKGRCRRIAEVPIRFELRSGGRSKFGARQAVAYARHLLRLYRFRFRWLVPSACVVLIVMLVGAIMLWNRPFGLPCLTP